jgi:hypothetical protein
MHEPIETTLMIIDYRIGNTKPMLSIDVRDLALLLIVCSRR